MRIILIGLPGSGKTTLAKLLSKRKNLCFVSTGQILREMVESKSSEGLKIKKILEDGGMVDDTLAAKVVKGKIESNDCLNGFVIDGYPKTYNQLSVYNPGYDLVFFLDVPESVAKERLGDRGRFDDNETVIDYRFELFRLNSLKLIEDFKKEGKLIDINANQNIEEVYNDICKHLN